MAAQTKDKRIELRVTAAQKQAIETAAAIEGRSVTDFSTSALTARAEEVIQRDRQVRVDAVHFDAFVRLMEGPARDLAGLRELLDRPTVFVD